MKNRYRIGMEYASSVIKAGGIPIILPPILEWNRIIWKFVMVLSFTGGDDPRMEEWGIETHPNTTPVTKQRQAFELSFLKSYKQHPEIPVLGCLSWECNGCV